MAPEYMTGGGRSSAWVQPDEEVHVVPVRGALHHAFSHRCMCRPVLEEWPLLNAKIVHHRPEPHDA